MLASMHADGAWCHNYYPRRAWAATGIVVGWLPGLFVCDINFVCSPGCHSTVTRAGHAGSLTCSSLVP